MTSSPFHFGDRIRGHALGLDLSDAKSIERRRQLQLAARDMEELRKAVQRDRERTMLHLRLIEIAIFVLFLLLSLIALTTGEPHA